MSHSVCNLCNHRHNVAHQCPVFRLRCNRWVAADDEDVLPPVPVHELSEFSIVCPHCRARSWRGENMNCCAGGRLQLPLHDDIPEEIQEVILSAHVRSHIRRFAGIFTRRLHSDCRWQVQHGVFNGIRRSRQPITS